MRKAIVYASVHHGNTEKIVKSIAERCQVDLIDAVKQSDADLRSYDMIGFASGIYFSKFHQSILKFAEKNLSDDKKVFLICTYGGSANYRSIEQILDQKTCQRSRENLDAKDMIHLVPSNWLEVLQKDIRMIKISKMQWSL